MNQSTLDFLERHSSEFIEMASSYHRMERLANPDGYGKKATDCGDTIEVFLTVSTDSRIECVSLQVEGCLNTVATANAMAEMAEGRTIEEAWEISARKVFSFLKTLEDDHFHCAELAVDALCAALVNYRDLKQNTWKKRYQSQPRR